MAENHIQPKRVRQVDEIVFVSANIFETLENFRKIFGYTSWDLHTRTEKDAPKPALRDGGDTFSYYEAAVPTANGISLRVVEPLSGGTVYRQFLERFGPGIMGLRERVPDSRWEGSLAHFAEKNIPIAQQSEDEVWMDLTDSIGGMHGLVKASASAAEGERTGDLREIFQVCIVTDDDERTAAQMMDLLGLGPWEIGHANNQTVTNMASAQYPAGTFPPAEFLPGILRFGNIEFELVQPVKGPLPYFDYLKRHPAGYHHIKETLRASEWDATLRHYADMGVSVLLSGKIGPCGWSNLDTEALIGCVYELSDGVPMDKLPDGYDPYFYPPVEKA